jgi:molybdopterin-containing oxidoreductase family iron-sulfur binding subunit
MGDELKEVIELQAPPSRSRRRFLQDIGLAVTAAAVGSTISSEEVEAAQPVVPLPSLPDPGPENLLLRMQADLQRAMKKPIGERRWGMAIDLRKCIGCSACTIACVAENKLPPGVVYRPVIEEEIGEYPHVTRRFIPRPCLQCDNPPCVPVCPVKATYTRPDGIVEIDYKACIGCRYCIAACPYGARTADFGEFYTDGTPQRQAYESQPSHEYTRSWRHDGKGSPAGNARKCHFCIHRLEAGMLPACVTTCVGYATFFGDLNDPESLIHELAGKSNMMRLKEELGTKPKVFYLT